MVSPGDAVIASATPTKGAFPMAKWAVIFLVIAIIAAILGFSGIAGAATNIAWILFVVFLVLAVIGFFQKRSAGT